MGKQNREDLLLAFVVAFFLATSIGCFEIVMRVNAESAGISDSWPMYRHDLQRTGYSTSTAPDTNQIKWIYNTTTEVDSSPAVVNGRVIVGVSNGDVLALSATTGEKLWVYESGAGQNSIWSSPAVDSGKVFIGTRRINELLCLDESSGSLLWSYPTGDGIDSSPAVKDGRVYYGSDNGKIYCLNSVDGSLIWNTDVSPPSGSLSGGFSSPAIEGNMVFIGSSNSTVYALNALTGTTVWAYQTAGSATSSPTVNNGQVFFGSNSTLYCVEANAGTLIWNVTIGGEVFRSSPAITNGRLFIGTGSLFTSGSILCLNAVTGNEIWQYPTAAVWSSPAVADGKVFVGASDGKIYCLDEVTGALIWDHMTLERIVSSPAIYDDTVFVGCGGAFVGGRVYAFGAKHGIPTSLTLSMKSQTSLLGFKVNLNGVLKSNNEGIADASIVLSYSVTDGQKWNDITAVPTSADGSYSAVWQPSATGTYLVKASWVGNYPLDPAESSRMLSVTTVDDNYVFSVSSNSTVSALYFNSTTKELAFTVTGPDRTTGFVDVTIAKSLVPNIANLKIYMDGTNLNYEATSTAESWLLHFTYTHSTHKMTITLNSGNENPTLPPTETLQIIWVILAVAIAIAICGSAFAIYRYTKRKKNDKINS